MDPSVPRPGASGSLRQLAEESLAKRPPVDLAALAPDQVRALAHELEVHRIELEIQNEELRRAQLEASQSRERYRRLYEWAPTAYLTLDPAGRILSANHAAAALLGLLGSRLLGEKLSRFVAQHDQDTWYLERRSLMRGGERRSFELELERPDGGVLQAQLVGSTQTDETSEPDSLQLALLDLTELREAERALRAAVSEAVLAEQQERRRLAADLHDDAGQLLSLASLKLRALRSAPEAARTPETREIEELLGEVRQRISSLSFQLSPPLLYDVGLGAATEWLAEDLKRRYGLAVSLSEEPDVAVALDETTRVLLFRALRELLVNVAKHAGVAEARVCICRDGERIRVEVQDTGVGFDPEAGPHGFGLLAIRERVKHLGGSIEVRSVVGRGTLVVIRVPFARGETERAEGPS